MTFSYFFSIFNSFFFFIFFFFSNKKKDKKERMDIHYRFNIYKFLQN